jgi:hypothetical protein
MRFSPPSPPSPRRGGGPGVRGIQSSWRGESPVLCMIPKCPLTLPSPAPGGGYTERFNVLSNYPNRGSYRQDRFQRAGPRVSSLPRREGGPTPVCIFLRHLLPPPDAGEGIPRGLTCCQIIRIAGPTGRTDSSALAREFPPSPRHEGGPAPVCVFLRRLLPPQRRGEGMLRGLNARSPRRRRISAWVC